MLYILTGLVSALLFGLVSFSVYGHGALLNDPWIEYTVWWLIGTGVALAALDNTVSLGCRLCRRIPRILRQSPTPSG